MELSPPERKRVRLQFRLRTLLLVVMAVSVGFSVLAVKREEVRRRRAAIERLRASGAYLAWGELTEFAGLPRAPRQSSELSRGPAWERWLCDPSAVSCPSAIELNNANDKHMRLLAEMRDLKYLELRGPDVTDAGAAHLKDLTELETLVLLCPHVTDDGLAFLRHLRQLQILILSVDQLGDVGLSHVAGLHSLRRLSLYGSGFTDDGLKHLAGLGSLDELHLSGSHFTDEGLKHLACLRRLSELSIQGGEVSGSGFAHLRTLPNLAWLKLRECPVEPQGLANLKGFPKLYLLELDRCPLDDAGLREIAGIDGLRDLKFDVGQVTPEALVALSRMPAHVFLEIRDIPFEREGYRQAVESLSQATPGPVVLPFRRVTETMQGADAQHRENENARTHENGVSENGVRL